MKLAEKKKCKAIGKLVTQHTIYSKNHSKLEIMNMKPISGNKVVCT